MTNENSCLRTVMNADGAAILDTEAGQITTLNSTGAMVWQGLERGEDLNTIAATIVRETGAEIDAVKVDIRGFMDELRNERVLPQQRGK